MFGIFKTRSQKLAARVAELTQNYELNFAMRSDPESRSPLEYHLHLLACYWSRMIGFCAIHPADVSAFVGSDLGTLVTVGTDFADKLIQPADKIFQLWQSYKRQSQSLLQDKKASILQLQSASQAFDDCLSALGFMPWNHWKSGYAKTINEK